MNIVQDLSRILETIVKEDQVERFEVLKNEIQNSSPICDFEVG